MATHMTITINGVADTAEDLQAAIDYMNGRSDIVSCDYDEGALTIQAVTQQFDWLG